MSEAPNQDTTGLKHLASAANTARKDVNTAKNLAKAGGKLAAQDYLGAAADTAKELLHNPEFIFKLIMLLFLPLILIVTLIASPLVMTYSQSDDGSLFFTSSLDSYNQNSDAFQGAVHDQLKDVIINGYKSVNSKIVPDIEQNYNDNKGKYPAPVLRIINPLDDYSCLDQQLNQIYASYSVLQERAFLSVDWQKLSPEAKKNKENELFNPDVLKNLLTVNYRKVATYSLSTNTELQKVIEVGLSGQAIEVDKEVTVLEYLIELTPADELATTVFFLKDNSQNTSLPTTLRYNELEMARQKTIILSAWFDNLETVYDTANNQSTSDFIISHKLSTDPFNNINFPASGRALSPLRGASQRVASPYGFRVHPITHKYKLHTGIDLAASAGTNIYPFANGRVINSGYNKAYGNFAQIYHGEINGTHYVTFYAHLVKPANVISGDDVTTTTVIGNVGSTGYSTGPHLHFEIKKGTMKNKEITLSYTDPAAYIS